STFSYQFNSNDTASVTLEVHNFGENCTTVQQIVTGTEQECDASFAYTTDADSLNYRFYALQAADEYKWIINDEIVSTDSVLIHSFQQVGTNSVTLTLGSGNVQCTATREISISNNPGCQLLNPGVAYSDSLTYSFWANQTAIQYQWIINDQVVSTDSAFTYSFPGFDVYSITFMAEIENDVRCYETFELSVNNTICSNTFNYSPISEDSFTYSFSSGQHAESYRWIIADRVVSTDSAFTYTFPSEGIYTVTHSADITSGLRCYKEEIIVVSGSEICNASFTSMINPADSLEWTFFPHNQIHPSSYEWSIDGQLVSTDSIFTYDFPANGNYLVSLTIINDSQRFCSEEVNIQVLKNYDRTYRVQGLLYADVLPVDGGMVEIYSHMDNTWKKLRETGTRNGDFQFDGLPEGEYLLYARGNQQVHFSFIPTYFVNGISWADAYHLDLRDSVEDIKITLIRSESLNVSGNGLLRGKILDNEQIKTPVVLLKDAVSQRVLRWTLADNNNEFNFEQLPYGSYQVTIEVPGSSFSRSFELTESRNSILDFEMEPGVVSSNEITPQLASVAVYPTRFAGEINLRNDGYSTENLEVEIINLAGKVVLQQKISLQSAQTSSLSVNESNPGILILKIINEKGEVMTKRLIRY
ncbi:MAG: T9SS type A sorting domain-containing protein, partial [Cyclobacteriaceae bacterium]